MTHVSTFFYFRIRYLISPWLPMTAYLQAWRMLPVKFVFGSTHCTILDTERVSPVDADMPPSEACTRCCSWCHHRRIRVEILLDKSDIRTQHCRRSPRKLRPIDTPANRIIIVYMYRYTTRKYLAIIRLVFFVLI